MSLFLIIVFRFIKRFNLINTKLDLNEEKNDKKIAFWERVTIFIYAFFCGETGDTKLLEYIFINFFFKIRIFEIHF